MKTQRKPAPMPEDMYAELSHHATQQALDAINRTARLMPVTGQKFALVLDTAATLLGETLLSILQCGAPQGLVDRTFATSIEEIGKILSKAQPKKET